MIQPVEEIPRKKKNPTCRELVRDDILTAIEQGILQFEFVGHYNFQYLAKYAREEADRITREELRKMWKADYEKASEKGIYIFPNEYRFKSYIRIHSFKGEDRIHVFCLINPEALKEYAERERKRVWAEYEEM